MGKQVTVVEAQPRLMARAVAPVVSEFFRKSHAAQGVEVRLDTGCARIHGGTKAQEVELADGTRRPADLVVVGVGVTPNVTLARDAGLDLSNGITVDGELRTRDTRIFAIGDCADFPSRFGTRVGARVRLESVQNCVDQATCVALSITGHRAAYSATPWFWSDQYDIRLQMAGLPHGFDRMAVRGDPETGKFSVFFFTGNHLLSVDSVNRPADHLAARKLLGGGIPLTPDEAADEGFDLKARSSKPAQGNDSESEPV
jgi:3-phenylpropionate/trans-cinnamate dioxygenase ferredoxin reductase subunit